MAKNLYTIIGVGAVVVSTIAFFSLQQQVKPAQENVSKAKQTLVKAQKQSDKTSKASSNKSDTTASTSNNTELKISADAAYQSYQAASQDFLKAYIKEAQSLKSPLQNIDQNSTLAPLSAKFGSNGVPDTKTSDNSPSHLLFEPYAYKNPKMTFSTLTPKGKGMFNGRVTVTSDGSAPIDIEFAYDTNSNLITKLVSYTEKSSTTQSSKEDPNDSTTGVPTSPIFPNPTEES